ncbi:MAG TPA: DUF4012 domain-containing protein [Candidatus Dormibacteraeota bacterium]|nr:DUF4012 domain-containing protein [Candidatus Dormibacteraeota bacterium]
MRSPTEREPAPRRPRASESRPKPSERNRPLRRRLALGLIVLLLAGGLSAYLWEHAVQGQVTATFHSAAGHLEQGKSELETATAKHRVQLVSSARDQFQAANADFRKAQAEVEQSGGIHLAEGLPGVGGAVSPRVVAIDHLAAMGIAITGAAERGADVDALLLEKPAGGPTGTARLLTILRGAQAPLEEAKADLGRAQSEAQQVNPAVLPQSQVATLRTAEASIKHGLSGVAQFQTLLPILGDLLGASGPMTYLLEQVNPFELRAGGGYIGTYSLLQTDQGKLQVLQSGDTHDLTEYPLVKGDKGYVAPPPTLTEFLDNKSWNLGDSNFFPDFPSNARAALSFAKTDFSQPVQGVVSMDLYAIQALLGLTGPITLPGTDTTVNQSNVLYVMLELDIENPQHKEMLGELAQPLMTKVTSLGSDRWPQLLKVLNQEASERHIQVYFQNTQEEQQFQALGWAGNMAFKGQSDFIYPVESNFGGNKGNYFLTRDYTLDLSRTPQGTLHHVVTVDLSLNLKSAPSNYFIPYRTYVRYFIPTGATGARITSVFPDDHPYTDVPDGTRVLDGWQQINPSRSTLRGSIQITFEYDTPWTANAQGQHEIYWQKQPGTLLDKLTVNWHQGSHTSTAVTYLSTDQVILLGDGRVDTRNGQTASIALPHFSI